MLMFRAILTVLVLFCFIAIIHASEPKVPESYQKMKNPLKPTKEVLASARKLYDGQCAACHGPEGKGDGAEVKKSKPNPPPADFTTEQFAKNSDQFILWRLSEGVPKAEMPGYKNVFPEKDRWTLVLLLRSFNPKTARSNE